MQLINRDLEKEGRYIPDPGCKIILLDENPNKALSKHKAHFRGYNPRFINDINNDEKLIYTIKIILSGYYPYIIEIDVNMK